MKRLIPLMLILIVFATQSAFAISYKALFLGHLGGNESQVYSGINNSGHVVGQSLLTSGGDMHAFHHNGSAMIDIKPSGGSYISARGINDTGQIVGIDEDGAFLYDGTWNDLTTGGGGALAINNLGNVAGGLPLSGGEAHAFFYDGSWHDLGTLGGASSLAYGINNSNVVVGSSATGSGTSSFMYDANATSPVMVDIGSSLGSRNQANGINNGGSIIGEYTVGLGNMAALYNGSGWSDLGALGDLGGALTDYTNSSARGINDAEYIVGYSWDSSLNRLATLWISGSIYNLNDLIVSWVGVDSSVIPTITLIEAWDINNSGQIAVNAFIGTEHYAFRLNPVPDPDTDGDGIPDSTDNCPETPNEDQADLDEDGVGNVCDNCPDDSNDDQADLDEDGVGNVCDNCPDDSNDDQADLDGDGVGDVCDPDIDGDGVDNDDDKYPESINDPTVIIDGCDSGVANQFFSDGASMSDLIAECAEAADNHGKFVSCVSKLTNTWKKEGLISGRDKGTIQDCAAQADIH